MNIHEILERASKLRIAVVGDFIKDNYIIGDVERISPEAPVAVVKVTDRKSNWGGAGNVAKNLQGLGVNVDFFFDKNSETIKTRVMSGNHHLLRIDDEQVFEGDIQQFDWLEELEGSIYTNQYDCVVISDYHKGVVSAELSQRIICACVNSKTPIIADAKKDFHKFANATVLKCNHKEYIGCGKNHIQIISENGLKFFIVTAGSNGLSIYYYDDGEGYNAHPVDIVDVCGAGDTVTALLAISIGVYKEYSNSSGIFGGCELAMIAASEVCRHPGVYPITKEDLIRRFNEVNKNGH